MHSCIRDQSSDTPAITLSLLPQPAASHVGLRRLERFSARKLRRKRGWHMPPERSRRPVAPRWSRHQTCRLPNCRSLSPSQSYDNPHPSQLPVYRTHQRNSVNEIPDNSINTRTLNHHNSWTRWKSVQPGRYISPRGVTILRHYLHPVLPSYAQLDPRKQKVIKSIVPNVHHRFDNDWITHLYLDFVQFEQAHIPLSVHRTHMCRFNINTHLVSLNPHSEYRISRQPDIQAR